VKIYTRTGDDGTTGLLGAGRLSKASPRVEAYGTVDELNAALGVARGLDGEGWLAAELGSIQAQLFDLGAELAAPTAELQSRMARVAEEQIAALEKWIDRLEADLPALTRFVLPAGSPLAAALHLARTVCRRAERRVVALRAQETVDLRVVRYLNRLADLLFVMARWCNRRAGVPEVEWRAGREG
jgi:cob(I)alamin adenosyltransferase